MLKKIVPLNNIYGNRKVFLASNGVIIAYLFLKSKTNISYHGGFICWAESLE